MKYQLQIVTLGNALQEVIATSDEMEANDENGLNVFFQSSADGVDLRDDQQWRICTDSAETYVHPKLDTGVTS